MEKYITQNGIKYELKGEQYYPMLGIAEQKERNIIGWHKTYSN